MCFTSTSWANKMSFKSASFCELLRTKWLISFIIPPIFNRRIWFQYIIFRISFVIISTFWTGYRMKLTIFICCYKRMRRSFQFYSACRTLQINFRITSTCYDIYIHGVFIKVPPFFKFWTFFDKRSTLLHGSSNARFLSRTMMTL